MSVLGFPQTWTDERIARLRSLRMEGLSASLIAIRLGGGVSRNGVIGKLHRLGLRSLPAVGGEKKRLKRVKGLAVDSGHGPRTKYKFKCTDEACEPLPAEDVPPAQLVTFAALERRHCRWPYGDPKQPGFGYCGGPAEPGLPYCKAHIRRAYRAESPSRKPLATVSESVLEAAE